MQMCSRCKKRVAVVFVTKTDKENAVTEGFCLKCAQELGLRPVNDMLAKMGISEEMLESLSNELQEELTTDEGEEGGAPAVELPKIFQNFPFPFGKPSGKEEHGKSDSENTKEKEKARPGRKFLSTYCHDLTADAREGKLDRIVGRDKELRRVIQILCRRQKNNPCLIGEPGVGKTAIAEALAIQIASGKVPYRLRDTEVWLVDLTALVSGTQFRGQFESRILGLLKEVKAAGNVVLVIDEVHNIVGSGDAEGGMNAANIMKPALSRGEIQVIGATTLKEYRKYIEKDSALERRFQPITVKEPSIEESVEMLLAVREYYEKFHMISIPEDVIRATVRLSERYITDRFLPDKAIDLLDEAASRLSIHSVSPDVLRKDEKDLRALLEEKAEAEAMPDDVDPVKQEEKFRRLADIKSREIKLTEEIERIRKVCENTRLTVEDIAEVIEVWTGIPATSINETEFEQLSGLAERLKGRLIGQDEAVDAVARAIKRKRAGLSYRKSPVSFIFAGPTGVGKTELVKQLSQDLFKQPESLIRLDMSEFMEKHSVSRIIGAPPGYVGYDEAGQLTEKIRRRPYSVVLFDEIEKAHPDVMNILLQVLDEGHITDAGGREVNFENTVIVMTTNAGSEKAAAISGFSQDTKGAVSHEKTMRSLSQFLRPEFINRVSEIITFNHLSREDFRGIVRIQLGDLVHAMEERGTKFTYTDEAADLIAERSYSEKFGARNLRRYLEKNVEDPIAEAAISAYRTMLHGVHLAVKNGELEITTI